MTGGDTDAGLSPDVEVDGLEGVAGWPEGVLDTYSPLPAPAGL